MAEKLWSPSRQRIAESLMTDFARWLAQRIGKHFPDFSTLHAWSIQNLEAFWEAFLEYTGLLYREPHHQVLSGHQMPGARWFRGMKLNFAENVFARRFEGIALEFRVEPDTAGTGFRQSLSYAELERLVARCARGLREHGVGQGDRVAGYLANVPEAVVACLACAALGATWSSASPDFGLQALVDRFAQVQPKLVFASTHYLYGGKTFRTDAVVSKLHEVLPSVETVVAVPYPVDEPNFVGDITWEAFLGPDNEPELSFKPVEFDHPLYILFSSGTTGAPKCMVHGTGGTLLQHRKELQLHCDLKPGDFLLYFTTCGWMMWNWQLSALTLGATIGLYDGNPGHPDLTAIWREVDRSGVTHFGTSGRFVESCMKARPAMEPGSLGAFEKLRTVLYTGSPLSPAGFRWVYETVKQDLHLAGISGGTDIVSCFILGNPNLPVYAGEIQCKGLGVDVEAFDESGRPVRGRPGELVCLQPLPSMPVAFLNDPNGEKYRAAYFDVFPGVWRHGDYVEFTEHGGVIVYGRSDATLNPGGVRIGSAEIYAALDALPEVSGAVVVGWVPPKQSDEIVVLFVVLQPGRELDEELEKRIRATIRQACSPRHVPHHVFQISAVPVTRSGKTVELSVKAILAGREISNRNALANPEVLAEFEAARQELLRRHQE